MERKKKSISPQYVNPQAKQNAPPALQKKLGIDLENKTKRFSKLLKTRYNMNRSVGY